MGYHFLFCYNTSKCRLQEKKKEKNKQNTSGRLVFCHIYIFEFQQEEEYWERRPVPDKNDVSVCIK